MRPELEMAVACNFKVGDMRRLCYAEHVEAAYARIIGRCAERAAAHKVSAEVVVLDIQLPELKAALDKAGFGVTDLGGGTMGAKRSAFCSILRVSWDRNEP